MKGDISVQRIAAQPSANLNKPAFLALGCIGFIASAPALAQARDGAQPADGEKHLKGMTVTDTVLEDSGYKVERAASPKAVAPLIDTPRSIVVLDKQVIKETGSATLVEALRTIPGITFGAAEGGNPVGDRPFIRGFDTQSSTYVDGVRDIASQSREIFAVDQIQVVRGSDSTLGGRGSAGGSINIISKLPQAENFYEVDGSLGTASYKRITLDANQMIGDMVGVRIEAMYHDQDVAGRDEIWQKRWGVAPSITIGLNEPTRLTASYYHLHTNELPDSGIPYLYVCSTTLCNAPTGFTLNEPGHSFTAANGRSGTVAYSTFYGLKNRDFRTADVDQFTLRGEHDFGDNIHLRNTARMGWNTQAYIYTQPDDQQGNFFNTGQVWRRANTRYSVTDSTVDQLDLYGSFKTGSIEHNFAVGGELSWERDDKGTFITPGSVSAANPAGILVNGQSFNPRCASAIAVARFYCTDAFNPNPNDNWQNYSSDAAGATIVPIIRSPEALNTLTNTSTKSIYAFDSITLIKQLILNLGIRYDDYHTSVLLPLAFNATSRVKLGHDDHPVSYQAGIVYKPTHNTSVYASYSTAATPPGSTLGEGLEGSAFSATVDPNLLEIEKTKSYEIGIKANILDEKLALTLDAFRTVTSNARVTGDDGNVAFVGKKRSKGIEFGFNGQVTEKWNIYGGYTYIDAVIADAGQLALTAAAVPGQAAKTVYVTSPNTGRPFPQTAKHSATIFTTYEVVPGVKIGGGAIYQSRVYGNFSDNRTATQNSAGVVTVSPITKTIARTVPGWTRFDATASWNISDKIGLRINVQNLTNKRYFDRVFTNHYAQLAPGRSALATLSVRY
jgi:catecholate siderophore receptor